MINFQFSFTGRHHVAAPLCFLHGYIPGIAQDHPTSRYPHPLWETAKLRSPCRRANYTWPPGQCTSFDRGGRKDISKLGGKKRNDRISYRFPYSNPPANQDFSSFINCIYCLHMDRRIKYLAASQICRYVKAETIFALICTVEIYVKSAGRKTCKTLSAINLFPSFLPLYAHESLH